MNLLVRSSRLSLSSSWTSTRCSNGRNTAKPTDVPHYQDLLEFLDLRAQASETTVSGSSKKTPRNDPSSHKRSFTFFTANTESASDHCILCESERHPLYVCPKFKQMSHSDKLSTLKKKNLCFNSGHLVRGCKSSHECRKCQHPHHTLLHTEPQDESKVIANTVVKLKSSSLLMACRSQPRMDRPWRLEPSLTMPLLLHS